MNKRRLSLLIASSAMVFGMVSCGGSDAPTTSLGKFAATLKNEANFTVEIPDYATFEYYSNDAMIKKWDAESGSITSYFPDQGYVMNKKQGIYSFVISSDEIVMGSIVTPNTKLSVLQVAGSPVDWLKENLWEQSEDDSTIFTTTSKEVYAAVTELDGYKQATDYVESLSIEFDKVEPTEATLTLKMDFQGLKENVTDTIKITNVGTTKNSIVSDYLEYPQQQKGVTYPYSDALTSAMEAYSGEVLPEIKGMTYASKVSIDDDYMNWKITDLKSGDLSKDVIESLAKSGWIEDEEKSKKEEGYSNYVLTKTIDEDGELSIFSITINYTSGEWIADMNSNSFYEELYPNGMFSIQGSKTEYYSYDSFKGYYYDYLKYWLGLDKNLPTLGWLAEPVDLTIIDKADQIYRDTGNIYATYSVFNGKFATKQIAESNFKTYKNNILAYGFEYYSESGYYEMYMNDLIIGINWTIEEDGSFEMKVLAVPYYFE